MAKVGIVMGSDSDMPVMAKAADILEELGITYEMTIISAKSPSDYREWTLGQLLPESFGPETLKED
jgi:5-(carboxyamino)imidazole ribonucleotide mutase